MGLLGKIKKNKDEAVEEKKTVKVTDEKEVKTVSKTKNVKGGNISYKVLVRPLVTEKSTAAESQNKYSFIVSIKASKTDVKKAILETYGVKTANIRTVSVDGKQKRYGKLSGRRSAYKKATVTLPKGKTITIHEGV